MARGPPEIIQPPAACKWHGTAERYGVAPASSGEAKAPAVPDACQPGERVRRREARLQHRRTGREGLARGAAGTGRRSGESLGASLQQRVWQQRGGGSGGTVLVPPAAGDARGRADRCRRERAAAGWRRRSAAARGSVRPQGHGGGGRGVGVLLPLAALSWARGVFSDSGQQPAASNRQSRAHDKWQMSR